MSNNIEALRDHLFATLDALRNKEAPMEIDRAKAVCQVAEQIIDSARVEVEFVKITGGQGSGFIPDKIAAPTGAAAAGNTSGILSVRRHQLKG